MNSVITNHRSKVDSIWKRSKAPETNRKCLFEPDQGQTLDRGSDEQEEDEMRFHGRKRSREKERRTKRRKGWKGWKWARNERSQVNTANRR